MSSSVFPMKEADDKDWRFVKLKAAQDRGESSCLDVFRVYKRTCPFSADLVDLIDGLLCVDPAKRLDIGQVSSHPWIAAGIPGDKDSEETMVYRSVNSLVAARVAPPPDDSAPLARQKKVPYPDMRDALDASCWAADDAMDVQ